MPSAHSTAATSVSGGPARLPLLLCFLVLAAGIGGYSLWVGPVGFMGDSYLFADRAKHLFALGNLDLNNHGNLIYPPLYSIVLAPLYALGDPARIITAMTLLNSLFVASAVFPVFCLVGAYAGVTGGKRWFFTGLIAASPTLVIYAPMVLTEACFIPLIYWTAYTVFRSLTDLRPRWFLATGLLMAAGLLTRSAATGIFLGGSGAWFLGLFFVRPVKPATAARLLLAGFSAFAGPLLVWHLFEKYHVTYQGGTEYSISTALRSLLTHRSDQLIKLHWALNGILYFLAAPLNLATFLILAACCRRPGTAWRDPLIPFVAAVTALAIVSIVILAPTHYGGNPLTWNKYFAPFVGLITIVALRLRPLFSPQVAGAAMLAAFLLFWAGWPSRLVCHFPDALTPFMDSAHPLPLSPTRRDLLFFLLLGGTVSLFLPWARPRAWWSGAFIATGLCLLSNTASALYWRNAGALNFTHYDGMALRLQEAMRSDPGRAVYYDPAIIVNDSGEALRFLFYHPRLVSELPESSLFLDGVHLPGHFLYVTRTILPSARFLAKEGESLRLYEVDGTQIRHDLPYSIKYGRDVGGQESITLQGKPVAIRWLGANPEFVIQVDQPVAQAQIGLRLGVCDHPRKVFATLNGQVLEDQPAVSRVPWSDGFNYLVWRVPLHAGENRLTLKNDSEPVTLPDGVRKVTYLLIDEPVVSRP